MGTVTLGALDREGWPSHSRHTFAPMVPEATNVQLDEVLRGFTMDSIANDYEDFEMITYEVTRWAAEKGLTVTPDQIKSALRGVVLDGLARAYRGSLTGPGEVIDGWPEPDTDWNLYYKLTPEGHRVLESMEDMLGPGSEDVGTS